MRTNPYPALLVADQAVLDLVAEPVEITGQVAREGEQLYLMADPPTYRRVR